MFGRLCRTDFGQTRALQLLKSKRKEIWLAHVGTVNSSARIFMQKGLKGILQTSLPNYPTGCIPTHCPVFFVALSGSETDPDGPATNVENDETYPSTKKTFWWSQNSQCTSKNRSVIILSTTEHLVVIHDWHTHTQTDTHTHRHTHTLTKKNLGS